MGENFFCSISTEDCLVCTILLYTRKEKVSLTVSCWWLFQTPNESSEDGWITWNKVFSFLEFVFFLGKTYNFVLISDEMVLVDCDADEEERKLLLSDSVTASPVYIKPSKIARGQGGQSGAAKEEGGGRSRRSILPLPRLAWTGSSSISTNTMSDSPDKECDKLISTIFSSENKIYCYL